FRHTLRFPERKKVSIPVTGQSPLCRNPKSSSSIFHQGPGIIVSQTVGYAVMVWRGINCPKVITLPSARCEAPQPMPNSAKPQIAFCIFIKATHVLLRQEPLRLQGRPAL